MRLLLDENVPAQLSKTLKILLQSSHDIAHVNDLDGWPGTQDEPLYDRAAEDGFNVVLTNDTSQMQRKHEVEAIARSGLHRVEYRHHHPGLSGTGLAIATVCAGLPGLLVELKAVDGQRLVSLRSIDPRSDNRYLTRDPWIDPPKHWPARRG
jgi:hypothetical protein